MIRRMRILWNVLFVLKVQKWLRRKWESKKKREAKYAELMVDTCRKLDLIEKLNEIRQKDIDIRILIADTSNK